MAVGEVSLDEVTRFLGEHHGAEVHEVELLRGGFWSAAYGYRMGDEDLVAVCRNVDASVLAEISRMVSRSIGEAQAGAGGQ